LTVCPEHGEEFEVVLFCKYCTRPLDEEFHEDERKKSMTEYYNLKEKAESKSDG